MRHRSLALLAALLASAFVGLAPIASAQEPAPFVLDDATGDVVVGAYTTGAGTTAPAPLPGGASTPLDLTSVAFEETGETFTFRFGVVDIDGAAIYAAYGVNFVWNDLEYSAFVTASTAQGWSYGGLSSARDGDWEYVTDLEHAVDTGSNTVSVTVPRVYILDGDDRTPLKGEALAGAWAYAANYENLNFVAVYAGSSIADRAPDGDGVVDLPVTIGGESAGHLRAQSTEPVRVSNGGATTFVFSVLVENRGAADDSVSLAIKDLPPEWSATVQSPVAVPANGEKTVPVLASVPFKHEHGGYSAFSVEARSANDPAAFATTKLGVLHTPVPQPAGHHPDVYLHTGEIQNGVFGNVFPYRPAFMSTDADHSADADGVLINAFDDGIGWAIDLEPGLRMGLDFDLEKLGTLVGAIEGKKPSEATLTVELWLTEDGEDSVLLAEAEPQPIAFEASGATPFEATLAPTEDADYVAYAKEQNLRLRIRIPEANLICCDAATTPELVTADFKLTLPLLEYHDRLAASPAEGVGAGLALVAEGEVERAGHPGDLITYAFTLRNDGAAEDTFLVSTAGTDATLGEVAGPTEIRLGSGESARVVLGVRVPAEAAADERFEVLLFARSQADPSVSAVGRTVTVAAFGAEAASDESAVFAAARDESKDTPGVGLGLGLGMLALAALATRRRA